MVKPDLMNNTYCDRCGGLSAEAVAFARSFISRERVIGKIWLTEFGALGPPELDADLTPAEHNILTKLIMCYPYTTSRNLLNIIGHSNDIKAHIVHLKHKIKPFNLIVIAVNGRGYQLRVANP